MTFHRFKLSVVSRVLGRKEIRMEEEDAVMMREAWGA